MSLRIGELFRFQFAIPSGTDADVLVTHVGETISGFPAAALTVRLFDGANLLGAVENYQDGVAIWKSGASPLSAGWPAIVVDFRAIANGTIDGRVEFTVTRGSVSIGRLDLATAELTHGSDEVVIGAPLISARDRELCR